MTDRGVECVGCVGVDDDVRGGFGCDPGSEVIPALPSIAGAEDPEVAERLWVALRRVGRRETAGKGECDPDLVGIGRVNDDLGDRAAAEGFFCVVLPRLAAVGGLIEAETIVAVGARN
ncbi:MAG: hypothetical protein V3V08_05990 [Nannocystaceae bacterium]